jgi:DNA-binding transcriptional MocR family regulator
MRDDNRRRLVVQALRAEAEKGAPGARLPSVRALMERLGASPVTIERALAELVREGLIVTKPGAGTFVAPRAARVAAAPTDLAWQAVALGREGVRADGLLDLLEAPRGKGVLASSGYPDPSLYPLAALAAATARAARRPGIWERSPVDGLPELRAWMARTLAPSLAPEEVMVTSGGQAALSAIFRTLVQPGDAVAMESPCYVGAALAARAAGARLVPVPADAQGVRPDLLERALEVSGARVLYAQPTYANPHGAVLAPSRRGAVLEVMRRAGAFLVEDDWARHLALEGEAPPPLFPDDPDGHVIYVGSLTKCVAPGFRVGFIAARGPVASRLRNARVLDEYFIAGPIQSAALELVTAPVWPRHLRDLRAALRERRDTVVARLERSLPALLPSTIPSGGLHLWLPLPAHVDETATARAARDRGVVLSPGALWFPGDPTGPFLRLTFGSASPAGLVQAVKVLGDVLAKA